MTNRKDPIIVEETFPVPAPRLWRAITFQPEMIQWFFKDIPEFEPRLNFETQFEVVSEGRTFTHLWKIARVIPGELIAYSWSYQEYPGEGMVTFRIEDLGTMSKLSLVNEGLESFPAEVPEFSRESCIAGWNYFLKDRLSNYLG